MRNSGSIFLVNIHFYVLMEEQARLLRGSSTVSHNCPSGMPYLQSPWLLTNRPSRKRTVRWSRQTVLLLLISTISVAPASPLNQSLIYSFDHTVPFRDMYVWRCFYNDDIRFHSTSNPVESVFSLQLVWVDIKWFLNCPAERWTSPTLAASVENFHCIYPIYIVHFLSILVA